MALRYHTVLPAFARASSGPSPSRASRSAGRRLAGSVLLVGLLAPFACRDDKPPGPSVRVDLPDSGARSDDDAGTGRPKLQPILPAADAEIVLPFAGPIVDYPIRVAAQPSVLDVHFSIDTTGSISEEIDSLQADLNRKIVSGLRARVANVQFGVSRFADFPSATRGSGDDATATQDDTAFELLTPITASLNRVTSAVNKLDEHLDHGGDLAEAGAEALFQIATGLGYRTRGVTFIRSFTPESGRIGGVGFRPGALRVVLHITDAPSHSPAEYGDRFPGTHSLREAGDALVAIGAKLVGIVSGACSSSGSCDAPLHKAARSELESLALATGAIGPAPSRARCPYGLEGGSVPALNGQCPLVFDVDGEGHGLSDAVLDGIVRLVDGIAFNAVSGWADDDPLGFIVGVVPMAGSNRDSPATADRLPEGDPDGRDDSFVQVPAKTPLEFRVQLANRHIVASDVEQVFRAKVTIEGDGLVLERRTLRIRVPAGPALVPEGDADAGH